jgi:hypothetical protein
MLCGESAVLFEFATLFLREFEGAVNAASRMLEGCDRMLGTAGCPA